MACIALCVKEANKSTFSRIHTPLLVPPETRQEVSALLVERLSPASGERSRHSPLPPASKTCKATRGGWLAWQRPSGTNFWSSDGLEGGQVSGGRQNVSPSPFYAPLLFGTELPKADGCADSLQIRADLRSSQRPNQKQLSSAGLREGLCCPLLAPGESAGGIYFIRFIYTHDIFGHVREGRRRKVRAQVQIRVRGSMSVPGSRVTAKLYCFGI